MSEKTNAKTATAEQAARNETADNTAIASGIIRTVQRVLRGTAESRDALPPGSAGSMGTMLCVAMDLLPCSERGAVKTSLGDVAHILGAAVLEKTTVSPTITADLADIIRHATSEESAHCACGCLTPARKPAPETKPGTVDERGRKYVATIQPPPDVAAAGITAIEIWSEVPLSDEDLAARRVEAINAARSSVEMKKGVDGLKKETNSLMDLVAKGALRDEETRKQVLQRLTALLHKFSGLNREVGSLPGGKAPRAERVPDWRDTQRVPGSGVLRDATGTTEEVQGKPVGAKEDKPAPVKPEEKPGKKGTRRFAVLDKEGKPALGILHEKSKPADGTAEISGYFTPEDAAALKERIREWLSGCKSGHRLGDLMTSIEEVFDLSDGQLGELVGISSRLVCNVRHGRPSPSALVKFTETFGTEGGAK